MRLNDTQKIGLVFLFFLIGFPLYFYLVPPLVAFLIGVSLAIIVSFTLWDQSKHLVIVILIYFSVSSYILIKQFSNLQLLFVGGIAQIVEMASLASVFGKFIEYFPFLLIFLGLFSILYLWAFLTNRGSSSYKFAILIGYIGIILNLLLIFIDMFIFSNDANVVGEVLEFVVFNNPVTMPFTLYFFIQFATFYMGGYTFIVAVFTLISGDDD